MTLDAWRQSGRVFRFQSHDIFYHDEGSGPALLCLHGFPTASWDWHRLWPILTSRFRTIAPDLLGFGFSAKPHPHHYSFTEQATLAETLLAHLGVHAALVLAHDYGDTVAQELLARHNEQRATERPGLDLHAVCLLNGGLFPEAIRPRPIQKLLKSPLGPLVAAWMTEQRFRKSFEAVFGPATQPTDAEIADFWGLITYQNGVKVAPSISRYQDERKRRRTRWLRALQETTVPLRLISGTLDPVSGATVVERYRQLIPDPDIVELDGIGHYPQFEAPERVLNAFLTFVDTLPGLTPPAPRGSAE